MAKLDSDCETPVPTAEWKESCKKVIIPNVSESESNEILQLFVTQYCYIIHMLYNTLLASLK